MRKLLFIIMLIPITQVVVHAQQNPGLKKSSYFTYVYQPTDREIRKILKKGDDAISESMLHTPVDSFPSNRSYDGAPGHYLLATARHNLLEIEYYAIHRFTPFLHQSNTGVSLELSGIDGQKLVDAKVSLNGHAIPYRPKQRQYSTTGGKRKGLLSVSANGFTEYFRIEEPWSNRRFNIAHIHHYRPIRYFWYPVRAVVNSIKYGPTGWVGKVADWFDPSVKDYRGFIAFNKPRYKKGDTIKLKAYVTKTRGKPIDKELDLSVLVKGKRVKLADISPYKKGSYSHELVIPDSLDIKSDRNLWIHLEHPRSGRALSDVVRFEQYELKETQFTVSSPNDSFHKGEQNTILLTAQDENGLDASDITAQISISPGDYSTIDTTQLFIPNTIFQQTIRFSGEKSVEIPDSIFRGVPMDFKVSVDFTDAASYQSNKTLNLEYNTNPVRVHFKLLEDSIYIHATKSGQPYETKALLDFESAEDVFLTTEVTLPAKVKVNPYAVDYSVQVNGTRSWHYFDEFNDLNSKVSCTCRYEGDSVRLAISNPRKIPLTYKLYKRNRLLRNSSSATNNSYLVLDRKKNDRATYHLHVEYVWAGIAERTVCRADFYEKNLNVEAQHPKVITPGQSVPITLKVTDVKGRPVKAADLTAYGYTAKFTRPGAPDLPYYGKGTKRQKSRSQYALDDELDLSNSYPLQWSEVKTELGLDTMQYYRWIYPENGYYQQQFDLNRQQEAELSPFYTEDGAIYQAGILYLDGYPVYYHESEESLKRYVIRTTPGWHHLKMRVIDKLITVDSIYLEAGKKTVISLSDEAKRSNIQFLDRPFRLTDSEKEELSKYLFKVKLKREEEVILRQRLKSQLIRNTSRREKTFLVGPFAPGFANYFAPERFQKNFQMEPGYLYSIREDLIKMRADPLKSNLSILQAALPINDQVKFKENALTDAWFMRYLKNQAYLKVGISTNRHHYKLGDSRIRLIDRESTLKQSDIQHVVLLDAAERKVLGIHKGYTRAFNGLQEGLYQLIFRYQDGLVSCLDSLQLGKDGTLNIEVGSLPLLPCEQVPGCRQAMESINQEMLANEPKLSLKETSVIRNNGGSPTVDQRVGVGNAVYGRVTYSEDGSGLFGASVVVKGANRGTITDFDGNYVVDAVPGEVLEFSFVGFTSVTVHLDGRTNVDVVLEEDFMNLEEVVVAGYGVSKKRNLTGSIASVSSDALQGRAAGVLIVDDSTGSGGRSITIRGMSSTGQGNPIYVIDGVVYDQLPASLTSDDIENLSNLQGSAASAIYGSRAANGVVLISTKTGNRKKRLIGEEAELRGSIRKNFHDDAFWQPKLVTNRQGEVNFKVKFPEDLTNWKLHFLAAASRKRTGQSSGQIKTFQPVSARLYVPNFLLEGDEITLRGTATNYTADSVKVAATMEVQGETVELTEQPVGSFRTDKFATKVRTEAGDSLKAIYKIRYKEVIDGEMRSVPVKKVGVEVSEGIFGEVFRDSTTRFSMPDSVIFRAYHHPLELLRNDFRSLTGYAHNCNEQMASKLLGWFGYQKVSEALGQEVPEYKSRVKNIIRKLVKHQNSEGLWGWWGNSKTSWWISRHVLRALLMAREAGFEVPIKDTMQSRLKWILQTGTTAQKIEALEMLDWLGNTEIAYGVTIDSLSADSLTLHQELRLIALAVPKGIPHVLDSVLSLATTDYLGGLRIGTERRIIHDNVVVNSALLLSILAENELHQDKQRQLVSFLMRRRKAFGWRNTYENSLILGQLMAYFMEQYSDEEPVLILTHDGETAEIKDFPYERNMAAGDFELKNEGGGQLFFTAYREFWNPEPLRADSLIRLRSYFGDTTDLKVGQRVTLNVDIQPKETLDYVMVTIPIPAGCSFQEKPVKLAGASHVEYDYDRAYLYFDRLNAGQKRIELQLISRFEGSFQLNPAKAELMYFPIYYGHEAQKVVDIDE